jgi:hypothetical protein
VFGIGWQELLLIFIVGIIIYGLFFSPPVRRRLTGVAPPKPAAPEQPAAVPPGESAEEILNRRFARGEIDQGEYEAKRAILQQNRT